ncbi:MAG TPA: MFS transporter [Pseudonocardiaceae bacterium]|nr:MFS transporter [Pseudonocardiaceae bacterium]
MAVAFGHAGVPDGAPLRESLGVRAPCLTALYGGGRSAGGGVAAGDHCGFGSLVWVYAGESFPAHLRSLGSSAMLTSDLVASVIVAAFFLTLLRQLSGTGIFAIFGALAVAGFVFVYRLAPETKGRRLEEIHTYWENRAQWPQTTDDANRAD